MTLHLTLNSKFRNPFISFLQRKFMIPHDKHLTINHQLKKTIKL